MAIKPETEKPEILKKALKPSKSQILRTDDLAPEPEEWHVHYLPHMGISSGVHFALLLALFAVPSVAIKEAAQKAVNYLMACQNPGSGWRYKNYNVAGTPAESDGNNDTSVTGWAIMALKSAKVAELAVPDSGFVGGSAFLDAVYDAGADYKGTFGYTKAKAFVHRSPLTTTSVGILVRLLMGQSKGVNEGASTVLERLPEAGKNANFYYWYYATLALFQLGGEPWTQWNGAMKDALCKTQDATHGCADGSWDPANDTWGDNGGRVYTTAVGALCLEVYYRYKKGMKVH